MDGNAAARPRFRSSIEPMVDADDGLFLWAEDGHSWLPGAIYAALGRVLDGRHSVEAVFDQLGERFEPDDILAALDELQQRRALADDTAALSRGERAWWERCEVAPSAARARLQSKRVAVRGVGAVDVAAAQQALRVAGLEPVAECDLTLVICGDPLHPDLAAWNRQALETGHAWMLVQPHGLQTWLGPAFLPGRTACWECLAQRLRWHRRLEVAWASTHASQLGARAHRVHNPAQQAAALHEAAALAWQWLGSGEPGPLADAVLLTHSVTHERTRHVLTRRPQCPACGQPEAKLPGPFVLQPRPKAAGRDGGHRSANAGATAATLERHLSPITGLVAQLSPGERTFVPGQAQGRRVATFAADHNFADMAERRFFLREGLRRRSGGKGQTVEQARISALAESLERYSGVFDGSEPRLRASGRELGEQALHPNAVMGYSERQYAQRLQANQRDHKAHWVPEPYRDDVVIDWTPLWSLTHGHTRHLPSSQCYFGYASSDPLFARADSNGCAAGAVREEAVLQGLLELIERDAVALWWYSRVSRPGLDLASSSDPYVADLQAHYHALKRSLWVLDITSDLGVPCFAALSARVDQAQQDILYGFGCHLDPAVALSRALTEVNQSLDAVPLAGGPPEAQTWRGSHDALRWWREATVGNQPYLRASALLPPTRMNALPDQSTARIDTDVQALVQRLAAKDIEVLVLDQTRPDVGLPVVRVVAPGLRHFWARFGPGRLYDVPVREGWIAQRLDEAALNPYVVQF